MSTAHVFGLARVSTDTQAIERQLDALHAEGIPDERIIVEHGVSGAASHRAGLDELLLRVRSGDSVVAAELSRLGRRTREVLELVEKLTERGVSVRVLQPALTFDSSPLSRLLLTLLAAVAEMELAVLRERTIDGLAAARARGRVGGRPEVLSALQVAEVRRMRTDGRPTRELAELFGCSERTIRRAVERGQDA